MTTQPTFWRQAFDATIGDIVGLALAQPHQVLLSTGSVALMAQFAAHGGIVDSTVGYLIAGGVEWAYLRGLASNAKAPTRWAAVLNWSAFAIVVLWGTLWAASVYGAFDLASIRANGGAWWLALAHVVPVAWLSLCAAMTHSAAANLEASERRRHDDATRARERRRQEAADELEAERARRLLEIEAEKERALARLEYRQVRDAAPAMRPASDAGNAGPARMDAGAQNCPNCGAHIAERPKYLAARRWGRCAACKEQS